ncbi:hypothetical protein [Sporomusa acidovorans]|uniref:Cytochrome b/b6 C-terminal region profile domain-containing protein n=1 Tax=Sporomusa acidovorans (strain ATCC 49682 / DSM 3132 / Mol) TaxID=1123286 RepID=A0ABZ3JBF2_SPOA4|nr:hypothetical protein [Sporomusa acidovorans]OZC21779.1 hypothetical protein SPACI_18540 [Sporomusa acidovorans DSM 3132]SDD57064.1 Cytochrome b(C-terminal)/b6/petD [Sporomusa acidovorans]
MVKQNPDPLKSSPFWPKHAIFHAIAIGVTALVLLCLSLFGLQKQDPADPVFTSPVPQPDWLFMMLFQVTRYFRDRMEIIGVFWLPVTITVGLILLPFMDWGTTRKLWLKRSIIAVSLSIFLALTVFSFHTCSTTPLWGCNACHKKGFGNTFASAPEKINEFYLIYDNKWLAVHYQYPQYFWMMDADPPAW